MNKKTGISIVIVALLLIAGVFIFNSSKPNNTAATEKSTAETVMDDPAETEAVSEPESISLETGNNKEETETAEGAGDVTKEETASEENSTEELPLGNSEETAGSTEAEKEEPSSETVQPVTQAADGKEQQTTSAATETETKEIGNTGENSTEADMDIYCSAYGVYGDTGEKMYYPCNEENYAFIISLLCEPEYGTGKYAQVVYDEVLGLSDRYKKEHPFSEGSILKPYLPNIRKEVWFTGSFDERYVVLKAYDTSNVKKYFLIEFTVTDDEKLDTVSIRELADDEVGE